MYARGTDRWFTYHEIQNKGVENYNPTLLVIEGCKCTAKQACNNLEECVNQILSECLNKPSTVVIIFLRQIIDWFLEEVQEAYHPKRYKISKWLKRLISYI